MNRSTQVAKDTVIPYYKERTFRKMLEMVETLVALDYRKNGLHVYTDPMTLSVDVCLMVTAFTKRSLTFQVVADGTVMILGPGHADNLSELDIPVLGKILGSFVKEHQKNIN